MPMINERSIPLALVLSGGGIRAMVFHLGLLRYMAERGQLEHIRRISTVSGGSLVVGLIFKEAGMIWPTSEQFLQRIYPVIREKLCERSLQWGALRQLLLPWNFRFFLSRTNLLALALRHEWGVIGPLNALPVMPEWSINGTTAENGKRFRFKRDSIGDYTVGYAAPNNFALANALAISAAFPGGFGPLCLDTTGFKWHKRPTWNAASGEAVVTNICWRKLHLYDGGVYDNLGLEPFFDAGKSQAKREGEFIIVSDAGAPLQTGFSSGALNPFRLKRVLDIMSEQSRALRVRTFINYIQRTPSMGAYLYISKLGNDSDERKVGEFAANFPTTLRRLTLHEFDAIACHGYNVAAKDLLGIPGGGLAELKLTQ